MDVSPSSQMSNIHHPVLQSSQLTTEAGLFFCYLQQNPLKEETKQVKTVPRLHGYTRLVQGDNSRDGGRVRGPVFLC